MKVKKEKNNKNGCEWRKAVATSKSQIFWYWDNRRLGKCQVDKSYN